MHMSTTCFLFSGNGNGNNRVYWGGEKKVVKDGGWSEGPRLKLTLIAMVNGRTIKNGKLFVGWSWHIRTAGMRYVSEYVLIDR